MQSFYFPDISEGPVEMPVAEARHAVQVLRKRVGDVLQIVDGKGGWYQGRITATAKKSCHLMVQLERQEARRAAWEVTLAVAPTKQNERFEWFLEKATEIGVDRIVPLRCQHSERTTIREDRFEKVLVSAMKQSLQSWKPVLEPLVSFSDFVKRTDLPDERYIGWCDDGVKQALAANYKASNNVCILIGPEGDFSFDEVTLAKKQGFQAITLGPNRLRTETAAVAAAQIISTLNTRLL